MYSCEQNHMAMATATATATGTGTTGGAKCQPRYVGAAAVGSLRRYAALPPPQQQQTSEEDRHQQEDARRQPRRPARRRQYAPPSSSSSSRRSSTTVVATDVANFRAMVQELTGFPPAAIFRPLPRRIHAAATSSSSSSSAAAAAAAAGGAWHSPCAATGSSFPDVPSTAQRPPLHPPHGVFDGLADLGSPELNAWADLSFE